MKFKFTILLIIIASLWHTLSYNSLFLEKNDNFFLDSLYEINSLTSDKKIENNAVVIVDIDEKSLKAIGQWPWPRLINSKLIDNISQNKPAAISIDIIFPEEDKTSPINIQNFYKDFLNLDVTISGMPTWLKDNDNIFSESIKNSRLTLPIYLNNNSINNDCLSYTPTYKININKQENIYTASSILCNNSKLQKSAKSIGFINALPDKDGVFRRVPISMTYKNNNYTTLGFASLLSTKIYENNFNIKNTNFTTKIEFLNKTFYTDKHTNLLLNFYDLNEYKKISALDILTNNFNKNDLLGKFIIIGTSAIGLHDYYLINTGETIPGMYAHATLIENFFNDDIISSLEVFKIINVILSLISILIIIILMYKQKYLVTTIFTTIITSIYIFSSIIAFNQDIYIFSGYFFINFISIFIFLTFIYMIFSYVDRKKFYEELSKSHQATLESMATVAETRDTDTGGHIIRTKKYIKVLAQELSKKEKYKNKLTPSFIESLFHAAPLHDLGKVGIPDRILKKPAKLTIEEFEEMKNHAKFGYDILNNAETNYKNNELFSVAKNIAYYHHEKWDGSGYPKGLKGEEIPIEARLMAVADVYDALINKRVYKPSFTYEDAENIILEGKAKHFDPEIVETFIKLKEELKQIAESVKN